MSKPSEEAMELVYRTRDYEGCSGAFDKFVFSHETFALTIDALVQRAVERERERCCRAVCKHCAEGNEPRPARDYDQPMHLFQGYPPRVCSAAALRATSNTGG